MNCSIETRIQEKPVLKQAGVRPEKTLKKEVSFSGIGIHTGKNVNLHFIPQIEGTGIVFKRVDLPGEPIIPASVDYVVDTSRSTILGKENVRVHTVEHVLSALRAYEIDNLIVEINNLEPPVGNGSSDVFVEMIEEAGIEEQNRDKPIYDLITPIYFSQGDIQIVALPAEEFKVSYTLSYPEHPLLKAQFHVFTLTSAGFKREIAPCRTFSLYHEVAYLMDKGLIKGGSLDNAVVIHNEAVFSKGGLFFPDEMVRHKILDLIGDLSLSQIQLNAHIISIRSGHASNCLFAKQLKQALMQVRS